MNDLKRLYLEPIPMNPWLSTQSDLIHETAQRHRIRSVRVFGSMARGEAGPGSDIDLLVELDVGAGLLDQVAFQQELEQRWSRKVDVVTPGGLHWYIREKVLAEAQPL